MKINKYKIDCLLATAGISSSQLAKRAGLTRQQVSAVKRRGTCNPVTAAKLAKGFGVPVTELTEQET